MEPLPRALRHIHRPFPPPPLLIPWIKHHINRAISSPIYHQPFLHLNHRSPPPLRPLHKGRAPPSSIAPLPTPLLFLSCLSTAHTECFLLCFFSIIARSPRPIRLPILQPVRINTIPSLFFLNHGEVPRTGVPFRPPSSEPAPWPLSLVHHGPALPLSMSHGLSPCAFQIQK
jgi:hypothetical protein